MADIDVITLAAAVAAPDTVNLWGALGCAVAYSASLLATLDAFADLVSARADAGGGPLAPGVGLRFASKLAAAAIAVIAAGIVLALDENWFAFTSLTIAFIAVVAIGLAVIVRTARRHGPRRAQHRASRPDIPATTEGKP